MALFKDALKTISDGISDMSQLNVRTFTGNITAPAAGQDAKDYMDTAFADGNLEVVALTRIKLDGDADQFFVKDDALRALLLPAHQEAIRAGQASRQAAFNLFTSKLTEMIAGLQDDE
jgi:hypothetical protein